MGFSNTRRCAATADGNNRAVDRARDTGVYGNSRSHVATLCDTRQTRVGRVVRGVHVGGFCHVVTRKPPFSDAFHVKTFSS